MADRSRRVVDFRGNHLYDTNNLSNTTCITHVFFKRGKQFGKVWCSGISRIRFIHASNHILCSSNVVYIDVSYLAILRIEGCLNSNYPLTVFFESPNSVGGWWTTRGVGLLRGLSCFRQTERTLARSLKWPARPAREIWEGELAKLAVYFNADVWTTTARVLSQALLYFAVVFRHRWDVHPPAFLRVRHRAARFLRASCLMARWRRGAVSQLAIVAWHLFQRGSYINIYIYIYVYIYIYMYIYIYIYLLMHIEIDLIPWREQSKKSRGRRRRGAGDLGR